MKPLVSILIPCYNAGPWIAQCIQSALDQSYPHKEVVVVDDGSQDNSLDVIRSFGDRIRFESGPNQGGNRARNRLTQMSNGEWLEFLDADDYLLPDKIDKQISLLENRPETDVIYSPVLESYEESGLTVAAPIVDEDLFANYFRWSYFSTTVLLLKKSAIMEVGGWNVDQPVCQEHELMLRLILAGKKFTLTPEARGINRMQNNNSVSRRSPVNTLKHKMALSDRLETYLLGKGEMTELRRVALARARFLAARAAYPWDRYWAKSLYARAISTGPFSPPEQTNPNYTRALRFFGLDGAERLAKLRRQLFADYHVASSPMTGNTLKKTAVSLNSSIGRFVVHLLPDSSKLIVLVFHALVPETKDLLNSPLYPSYVVSLEQFEQCVAYYLGHGFQAVSPADILQGLPPKGRYVLFTFDDGYANNLQVLPVLERHRVPVMFALPTQYIISQKAFWWDVVYKHRRARGDKVSDIVNEVDALVQEAPAVIEKRLSEQVGKGAFNCTDEASRPMRPDEIKQLAKHKLVFWANHTARHEYLPRCKPEEVRHTVAQAQEDLFELTGSRPIAIVYPYGGQNKVIRGVCRDLGLQLGFTMVPHIQRLNMNARERMAIPRFAICKDQDIAMQCTETRVSWKPSWLFWGHPASRSPTDAV